jgi:ketosteroid isomerase-like protein
MIKTFMQRLFFGVFTVLLITLFVKAEEQKEAQRPVLRFSTFADPPTFSITIKSRISAEDKSSKNKFSKLNKDLENMVNSEKSFAATAVKKGLRASFIKFFADDGIGFGPKPEIVKLELLKTPPESDPSPTIFNWRPIIGDISFAGDMGYTTGPVLYYPRVAGSRPNRHSTYFSVWQKQADKTWKVAIDMGVGVPKAIAPIDAEFTQATNRAGISKSKTKKLDVGNFNTIDTEFSADIRKNNLLTAYNNWLSKEFRIHRNGRMPILNQEELKKYIESGFLTMSFQQLGGKVARSKDLAFSYGSFEATGVKDLKEFAQIGYYLHVWRRDKIGKWKLTIDVIN